MEITSGQKKLVRSLHNKKFRDQNNQYIAEGFTVLEQAILSPAEINFILVKGSISNEERTKSLMSLAQKESIPVHVIQDKEFDKLSALETPPGVLAVIDKTRNPYIDADATYLVLDAIKDPGNLGSIIRSADWFGFDNIVIGKDSVDLYNPKVVQATMGSIFNVKAVTDEDLPTFLKNLQAQNYTIIATSLQGSSDELIMESNRLALLVGNETKGLNPELLEHATHLYKIPGANRAESLNVSVATGIVLFEIFHTMR